MKPTYTTLYRKITIHDMSGLQVKELVFTAGSAANIGELPCGTYEVRFNGSDGSVLSNILVVLRP